MYKEIDNLKIKYHFVDDSDEDIFEQEETIEIDRESRTLRITSTTCDIESVFKEYKSVELPEILDDIEDVEDSLSEDEPVDEEENITITVTYSDGSKKEKVCSRTRPSLPSNWVEIFDAINSFLEERDELRLFPSREYYNNSGLCEDEVRIAKVYFGEDESALYTYISDEPLSFGDVVIVPVGKSNRETEAIVSEVEIVKKNSLPTSYELKKVIDVIDNIYS